MRHLSRDIPHFLKVSLPAANVGAQHPFHPGDDDDVNESIRQRIERVHQDLIDLESFYNIELSNTRVARLRKYLNEELASLKNISFESYNQEAKVDYLLLKNYLERHLRQLDLDDEKNKKIEPLLPFAAKIISLCEARQRMESVDGKKAAEDISEICHQLSDMQKVIWCGKLSIDKTSAFRAANMVDLFRTHLEEWFGFFKGYDPMFSWWVTQPYEKVNGYLTDFASIIRSRLVGMNNGDTDDIVGDPIGYNGLLANLDAEMIPYTPEEIMEIGETEYVWCEKEMKKASNDLGYGDDWRSALEYVKELYVEPGKQPQLILDLAMEAINYVKEKNLVTVPPICEETWRMFMMTPEEQKTNPFFLGGTSILVSYPTDTMDHEAKLMSMRGNNIHFARSTVFHEMIPGHHLQGYMKDRHNTYRGMFTTPFWTEGWSLYWEMILWDEPSFPKTPENCIGMLFWRMHRCARIIFSLNFHLGKMTPQECIDFLVEKVGHERATAEGEVRRSFNGDYSPLYQAGYMLGALQFYELRNEIVGTGNGRMGEKEFHDQILRGNEMPVELVRALLGGRGLKEDFQAEWRFYQGR